MEYNTDREKLFLPEHGRNMQKIIEKISTIEDKEKRTKLTEELVKVMYSLNISENKDGDYIRKLWDQLFIMSDFALDIDCPYPIPTKESVNIKPQNIPYNTYKVKYRHYGKLVQQLANKLCELPDGEDKEKTTAIIATQMKKLYLQYNRESVDDEIIFKNLQEMSGYRISINPELKLAATSQLLTQDKPAMKNDNGKKKRKKSKNSSIKY